MKWQAIVGSAVSLVDEDRNAKIKQGVSGTTIYETLSWSNTYCNSEFTIVQFNLQVPHYILRFLQSGSELYCRGRGVLN